MRRNNKVTLFSNIIVAWDQGGRRRDWTSKSAHARTNGQFGWPELSPSQNLEHPTKEKEEIRLRFGSMEVRHAVDEALSSGESRAFGDRSSSPCLPTA